MTGAATGIDAEIDPGIVNGHGLREDDQDIGRLTAARDVIEREAIYLDERRWDDWLSLFTEECEYWVPAWRDDDALIADPQTEISHIYYTSRAALEDRIVRINSKLSPASSPLPRTTHMVGSTRQLEVLSPQRTRFRSSWATHVFWTQTSQSHTFFGFYEHDLVLDGGRLAIARKKIVLQNDYIPSMVDFYCL